MHLQHKPFGLSRCISKYTMQGTSAPAPSAPDCPGAPDAKKIAINFSKVLRRWLTPQELAEVVKRNAAQTDTGICHSHDFCGANMAMLEAFEENGLPVPEDPNEDHFKLWNAAWDIAKASNFSVEEGQ